MKILIKWIDPRLHFRDVSKNPWLDDFFIEKGYISV